MANDVMPFVRPSRDAIRLGAWQLRDESDWRPLPAYVPDWDYQMDLALRREISVDMGRVRGEASLNDETTIAVIVEWRASASQLVGLAYRSLIHDSRPTLIDFELPGADLSGRLTLRTCLVVATEASAVNPFVARHAGEVLLEDSAELQLQGAASRLPIYVVDFSAHELDEDAAWHIEVAGNPNQPAVGGVRVYLNQKDADVVGAGVRAANPTPTQRRILEWLRADVSRSLVEAGLEAEWLEQLPMTIDDPDSLGASINALIFNLFGGEPPEVVAELRKTDPGRFASRLQGALRRTDRGLGI